LCISPDKQYLAAASNPHVRLYDINSGHPNPIVSFKGHTSNVTAVAFHCEGKWMVTASEDHTLKIWDIRYLSVLSFGNGTFI
jgi:G protein beta subunit-like protein